MPILIKNIPGTEGKLTITADGRVFTREKNPVHGKVDKDGYQIISIVIGGEKVTKRVDKLVARLWIGKPEKDLKELIHIDGVKLHSHYQNLKWATKEELKNHIPYKPFTKNSLKPKKINGSPNGGKKGRGVKCIDGNNKEKIYTSPKEAQLALNIDASKIRKAIRSKIRLNNYKFEYT